ncbi:hypothetical protein NL676_023275 [Syzygium grande]|nr:hypothetical protein NL676_023275 [Syzygium grande]
MWWNEFKRKFTWDDAEDNEVRRIFDKKISDFMRNVMNRAKSKQAKPSFFTADNWVAINTFWASEQSRQLCDQNKKNRSSSSSDGSATYAGGSINIAEHRKRLDERIDSLEEQMRMVIQHLNLQRNDESPVPPANPDAENADADADDDDDNDFLQSP